MRLVRIRIEGYRAIDRFELSLDELTALIGENGYGKTSVVDALLACLGAGVDGPPAFEASDLHVPAPPRPPAGRILVELVYGESRPDERRARPALVPALVGPPGEGFLVLVIEARRGAKGPGPTKATFHDLDGRPLSPQPPRGTYAALRDACPVIALRAGRYHLGPDAPASGKALPALRASAELEGRITAAYDGLRAGGDASPEVLAGIEAATALVGEYAARVAERPERPARTRSVLESLSQAPGARRGTKGALLRAAGGAAHGLASLLILGALFRSGETAALGDADPLLVIEDPEANLHPTVAANLSRLIEGLEVQRLLLTNSGELLASVPLRSLRRAVRTPDGVRVHAVPPRALTLDQLRRVGYHVRANRADALFARCWLLVEGETEFWIMAELGRILGVDLPSEGVRLVEFAQCGVEPLIRAAAALGIGWHLLADGDEAGRRYAERAAAVAGRGVDAAARITLLDAHDVEHCLWEHGYDAVYCAAAGLQGGRPRGGARSAARKVIAKALAKGGKPRLALEVLQAAAERGPDGVPPPLRRAIESVVRLASDPDVRPRDGARAVPALGPRRAREMAGRRAR